ncbi:MAG: T9SS type A sorting domain-containing protein [Bacteroidales bacterium]|nr:T9SS type A sorting domain-containing protein [Bacteroidales bacterium]MCF8336887.1 T9SS type A sorting domain-containing protein [Bacteroidales bacterium]
MKRLYFLATFLLAGILSFGQVLIDEDFSGDNFPPEGWSIDNHAQNWSTSFTTNAGGVSPEANFHWSPDFNGISRLISPEVDASDYSELKMTFNHMIDHYGNTFNIGVATRVDGGDWNSVWEETVNSNVSAEMVSITIDNNDVGNDNFQVCLYFDGNSYNINDWYIDDIMLYNELDLDLAMSTITTPEYVEQGDVEITGTVFNMGANEITSFDVNWQVNDGTVHTSTETGVNIGSTEEYEFTAEDPWAATPGTYTLSVWISNINGGEDDNPDNDMSEKTINVATNSVQRRPLYEEFTSSTCGPCADFNSNTFTPFMEEHDDEICVVKYQMDWPGSGDPYYTEEGGVRQEYYGVSAVPSLFTDGKSTGTNSTAVNNAFDEQMATPAFMSIEGNFQIDGTTITATATLDSYINAEDMTVHMVVIEEMTTENTGGNGETEFLNVMMKMLPDAEGTTVDLVAGESYSLSYIQDLSETNIEEFDDLSVVIFAQNDATKQVFQSNYAQEEPASAPTISCNIENEANDVPVDTDCEIHFDQSVRELDDTELNDDNVDDHVIFKVGDENGEDVPFDATVNEQSFKITVTPDNNLEEGETYYLAVESTLENYFDVAIEPFETTFTTNVNTSVDEQEKLSMNIYPNPVKDVANIAFELDNEAEVAMKIYDAKGRLVHSENHQMQPGSQKIRWNADKVDSGIYFCHIIAGEHTKTVKLFVK